MKKNYVTWSHKTLKQNENVVGEGGGKSPWRMIVTKMRTGILKYKARRGERIIAKNVVRQNE